MTKSDKLKTLALIVRGLSSNEREREEFLGENSGIRFDFWNSTLLEKAFSRYVLGKKINYHQKVVTELTKIRKKFKKWKEIKVEGSPKFLLRADDFPTNDASTSDFLDFYQILEEYEISCLVGVTPLLSEEILNSKNDTFHELSKNEAKALKKPLVTVALHGLTHQTLTSRWRKHSEFIGLSSKEVRGRIEKGLGLLEEHDLSSEFFIPPFNAIDSENYEILSEYFAVIAGGPESLRTLGFKTSPCYYKGILYVPSYYPAYGAPGRVAEFIRSLKEIKEEIIVPLVIHWAGGVDGNFEKLKRLGQEIQGDVIPWKTFINSNS